ncbi:MAG: hypothetical protein ACREA8_11715 [Nitrosotalea sp.]
MKTLHIAIITSIGIVIVVTTGLVLTFPSQNTNSIPELNNTQNTNSIPELNNTQNISVQSCITHIQNQTIFAGYAGSLSCPIMPFQMSTKIVNYTGFYEVSKTLNASSVVGPDTYPNNPMQEELDKSGDSRMEENFVLVPGHTGTITYNATLSTAKCAGGCPDGFHFPTVDNQTNIAEFIHRQNNEMIHSHAGLYVQYDPQYESLSDGQSVTLKVTITASPDVPRGTYWVILTPGNCAGGPLILLTVSDCEK